MKEDEVVDDEFCPVVKPGIIMRCKTCENGCNPDGSCIGIVCEQKPICNVLNPNNPSIQSLLCQLECCNCRRF